MSCFSQDVHLADGWHAEEDNGAWKLEPGGGVCVYFTGPSNSRAGDPNQGLPLTESTRSRFGSTEARILLLPGERNSRCCSLAKVPAGGRPCILASTALQTRALAANAKKSWICSTESLDPCATSRAQQTCMHIMWFDAGVLFIKGREYVFPALVFLVVKESRHLPR